MTPIAIAVVVDSEGNVLIGQRPDGVPLAGLWEFPGGKIEAGETPEMAAARECLEETGLLVAPHRRDPPEVHQYEHGAVELNFVFCVPGGKASGPPSVPRSPYRWVPIAELSRYEFPAGNRRVLAILQAPPDSE